MYFTINEKIRIIAKRRGVSLSDLAGALGITKQALNAKLNRSTFSELEVKQIATALDCSFDTVFTFNDTGETI